MDSTEHWDMAMRLVALRDRTDYGTDAMILRVVRELRGTGVLQSLIAHHVQRSREVFDPPGSAR